MAADRSGYSKLKEAITAGDLDDRVSSHGSSPGNEEEGDEDGESRDEEDEEDFLTRELEEG